MARLAATIGLVVVVGTALVGCAQGTGSVAQVGASPAGVAPAMSGSGVTATAGSAPASAAVSPAPSDRVAADSPDISAAPTDSPDSSAAPIVVDPGLLAILPSQVSGAPVVPAPDTAARMIKDASLGASASAVAVAMAASPGASGGGELAVATVIQLRPGVYSDDFFARWRAAYDGAACEPAGGVGSHSEQTIGGHLVEVTLCNGGARTYNVHLADDRIVSVTSVGDQGFGDLLLAGLHE